jgi:hypothetical protein
MGVTGYCTCTRNNTKLLEEKLEEKFIRRKFAIVNFARLSSLSAVISTPSPLPHLSSTRYTMASTTLRNIAATPKVHLHDARNAPVVRASTPMALSSKSRASSFQGKALAFQGKSKLLRVGRVGGVRHSRTIRAGLEGLFIFPSTCACRTRHPSSHEKPGDERSREVNL